MKDIARRPIDPFLELRSLQQNYSILTMAVYISIPVSSLATRNPSTHRLNIVPSTNKCGEAGGQTGKHIDKRPNQPLLASQKKLDVFVSAISATSFIDTI